MVIKLRQRGVQVEVVLGGGVDPSVWQNTTVGDVAATPKSIFVASPKLLMYNNRSCFLIEALSNPGNTIAPNPLNIFLGLIKNQVVRDR